MNQTRARRRRLRNQPRCGDPAVVSAPQWRPSRNGRGNGPQPVRADQWPARGVLLQKHHRPHARTSCSRTQLSGTRTVRSFGSGEGLIWRSSSAPSNRETPERSGATSRFRKSPPIATARSRSGRRVDSARCPSMQRIEAADHADPLPGSRPTPAGIRAAGEVGADSRSRSFHTGDGGRQKRDHLAASHGLCDEPEISDDLPRVASARIRSGIRRATRASPRRANRGMVGGQEALQRGRYTTITQIRDWLTANEPPEPPFGSSPASRAGKSRVSARAVLEREADRSDPGWGSPRPPVVLAFVDFGCESALRGLRTQDP